MANETVIIGNPPTPDEPYCVVRKSSRYKGYWFYKVVKTDGHIVPNIIKAKYLVWWSKDWSLKLKRPTTNREKQAEALRVCSVMNWCHKVSQDKADFDLSILRNEPHETIRQHIIKASLRQMINNQLTTTPHSSTGT